MKPITILGAGLVGSLLAIYLAKRGYKVTIYERRSDMRKEKVAAGRSINLALSDRGWRALQGVGLEEEIRQLAIPMQGRYVHNENGSASKQPYGREGQAINSVSRAELNKKLMSLAEQHENVTIEFNHFCNRVDLQNQVISFSSGPADNNTISTASYEVLFGADGAYSSLRYAMQFIDRFNYSQTYIEHGYKELTIEAGKNGEWLMEKNYLHIWPRHSFMLIALPNRDGSFTCTLFFPFEGNPSFSSLKSEEDIGKFFKQYFPDAIPLMPTYKKDFFENPTSSLVTVNCFPWTYRGNTCLIGDAAHAIVPFFGQGMNAGFEDCRVLNELMDTHSGNWQKTFSEFQTLRKNNADAIAELALNNFIEMRDLVADPHFLHKKKIEKMIAEAFPEKFISPYQMVSFSNLPYSQALEKGRKINQLLEELAVTTDLELRIHSSEMKARIDAIFRE